MNLSTLLIKKEPQYSIACTFINTTLIHAVFRKKSALFSVIKHQFPKVAFHICAKLGDKAKQGENGLAFTRAQFLTSMSYIPGFSSHRHKLKS